MATMRQNGVAAMQQQALDRHATDDTEQKSGYSNGLVRRLFVQKKTGC